MARQAGSAALATATGCCGSVFAYTPRNSAQAGLPRADSALGTSAASSPSWFVSISAWSGADLFAKAVACSFQHWLGSASSGIDGAFVGFWHINKERGQLGLSATSIDHVMGSR